MRCISNRRAFAIVVLPLALCACSSISDSAESASKSVSTGLNSVSDSFESSSRSSTGDSKSAANYRADLRAYTLTCLGEPEQRGESGEFVRGIGRIAELHGITDWESNANTVTAIREVVATGAIDDSGVARLRNDLANLGAQVVDAVGADR